MSFEKKILEKLFHIKHAAGHIFRKSIKLFCLNIFIDSYKISGNFIDKNILFLSCIKNLYKINCEYIFIRTGKLYIFLNK